MYTIVVSLLPEKVDFKEDPQTSDQGAANGAAIGELQCLIKPVEVGMKNLAEIGFSSSAPKEKEHEKSSGMRTHRPSLSPSLQLSKGRKVVTQ